MKTLVTSAALLTLSAGPALAADPHADEPYRGTRATLIFGNAIAGTLLGGPIGAVAGAATGIWVSDRVIDGYASAEAEQSLGSALADARADNIQLQQRLTSLRTDQARWQQLASDSLEFQVLFHTGDSALAATSEERIVRLAAFLAGQQDLRVELSGYTDPRGDDAFNESLSRARAEQVAELLEQHGVQPGRIGIAAYGKRLSQAPEGNLDAYALERRVSIELVPANADASVASR